ncbi:uncharacterized protein LOC106527140 [Austrofundulus limnaeus]|uniref:Uncharacterized protein LOC106527140 n=1 Tax=Austrofundulus limnaeus TaxID=52670 RepID=A0A2I4CBM2_AUSLI|nr:PREDICTED: uncharacterized protein LOC106527140 [Austrofundulus limnaeus]
MLTLKQLIHSISPGDWFATIDLTDAYFHIAIHPEHRKYLRFTFTCFTSHIQALGFLVNTQKSLLTPSQQFLFLGQEICSLSSRASPLRKQSGRISPLLSSVSTGTQTELQNCTTVTGNDGFHDFSSTTRAVKNALLWEWTPSSSLARCTSVCVSPSGNDTTCTREGARTEPVFDPSGTPLASEVLVHRDNQLASSSTLATSGSTRSPLSGRGGDFSPTPRTMEAACLPAERSSLLAKGLSPAVIATIQNARASSTRGLYSYKWQAFERWCKNRHLDPFQCAIGDVLTFLQELLDKGLSFSTIKVYLAAISA